jgi:hypothetical protein
MNLNEQISRIKQVMNLNEDVDDKLKSALFAYFDFYTKDADLYFEPQNKSIWMIFPEEKKWVFELETINSGLWYNYHFFKKIFDVLSLDTHENNNNIELWVERILKTRVKKIGSRASGWQGGLQNVFKYGTNFTLPFELGRQKKTKLALDKGNKIDK